MLPHKYNILQHYNYVYLPLETITAKPKKDNENRGHWTILVLILEENHFVQLLLLFKILAASVQ